MSRIPLTDVGQLSEPIRDFMARRGELNVFRLLAHAPEPFLGWAQMVDELLDSPTFSARMREAIILRVAHLQGSAYELAQHAGLARDAGLTQVQIDAIVSEAPADVQRTGFDASERVVLEAVTELCTTRRLREESFAAVRAALGDAALTEMLMVVSCYYGLALMLNAAELEVDTTARLQSRSGEES